MHIYNAALEVCYKSFASWFCVWFEKVQYQLTVKYISKFVILYVCLRDI